MRRPSNCISVIFTLIRVYSIWLCAVHIICEHKQQKNTKERKQKNKRGKEEKITHENVRHSTSKEKSTNGKELSNKVRVVRPCSFIKNHERNNEPHYTECGNSPANRDNRAKKATHKRFEKMWEKKSRITICWVSSNHTECKNQAAHEHPSK